MKPIIIDLQEMSDTQEVYDSRPNRIFSIFIYLMIAILIIALIWMYFGRVDVVIKSEAILRPNQQISTVVNEYEGKIQRVYKKDGTVVKKGDILYKIDYSSLQIEKDYLQGELQQLNQRIDLFQKYKKSIEEEENYFAKTGIEEEFYARYQLFSLQYNMAKEEGTTTKEEVDFNKETAIDNQDKLQRQVILCQKLKDSIERGRNLFVKGGEEEEYYNKYEQYKSQYKSIDAQYDIKQEELEQTTSTVGIVSSLEYYKKQLTGTKSLKRSVVDGKNYLDPKSSYGLQYLEYERKIDQLENAYVQAKTDYESLLKLKDSDNTEIEISNAKVKMEEAKKAIGSYKNTYLIELSDKISQLEKDITDLQVTKESILSSGDLLKENEKNRERELKSFTLQYTVGVDEKIAGFTERIEALTDSLSGLDFQGKKGTNTEENLLEIKNTELQTTILQIGELDEKAKEVKLNVQKLEKAIEGALVKSAINGVVNYKLELVEGDSLQKGISVLSIIPKEESQYKAEIYVSNKDIGKVREGMNLQCNVYAFPNRDYGYLTGKIVRVAKDIQVDNENVMGYYLVEAQLDKRKFYDSNGKEAKLKAGMGCQAQMITENKRILSLVLEKLDFWH